MLIVLEGPDGAGKTTLAASIVAYEWRNYQRHVEVWHKGPAVGHPLDEYELAMLDYKPGEQNVVCDRWHLGEAIYPRVLKRETSWDLAVAQHVHLFMQSRGAHVVVLRPSIEELRDRYFARGGDDLITSDQLAETLYAYEKLDSKWYHTAARNELLLPRHLIGLALTAETAVQRLRQFETYVGPPRPKLLLFGEKRQVPRKLHVSHSRMPAFCPYPATSGHFLLSHLNVVDEYAGVANACDVDDPGQLWEVLERPPVVALGRAVQRRLSWLGIPHGAVPHPQYVRRFHYRSGADYARLILATAKCQEDHAAWRPS